MQIAHDPILYFQQVQAEADEAGNPWPEAMSLATADAQGRPSNRMVLLRGCDERGFVFYTNDEGRKGRELAGRPWAALCFWWPETSMQVRVEGSVERVTAAEADTYFASRPRGHQIGAWASEQSRPLLSRDDLQARVAEMETRYAGQEVPRPPHWGGYRVCPERIEFWHERPNRLHDREVFERTADGWKCHRLQP